VTARYQRGVLLFEQQRYQDAVSELRAAVAEQPEDVYAWGLLALSLSELEQRQQALEAAHRLVELAPDFDYSHYILARVELDRSNLSEARAAIERAIELDPNDAVNFAVLAGVEYHADNWQKSLDAAERGLALDPEQDGCRHWRTLALVKLGRTAEAEHGFSQMLEQDPNDPYAHSSRGWFLLERGDSKAAREHFIESLRLDPTNDGARAGLANALKAQHRLFGLILQLLLYLGRFRTWMLWAAAIVIVIGMRFLDQLSARFPEFYWLFFGINAAIWTVIISTMIAHPLFDLILRFDKQGRHALSENQVRASNWHAVCLVVALLLAWVWAWKNARLMGTLAFATLMLMGLITHTCNAPPGWVRKRMAAITIFAALLIPFSYVFLIVSVILIVKLRLPPGPLLKAALLYIPCASMLISMFGDNILEWLMKRRPDPRSA
jgi:tetratricopeptide (TPR) repeat protein